MAVRFELAMLASRWMKLYQDMTPWSLTSLDLKRRSHLEKYWVLSFYGKINTSCFRLGAKGGHRLLRVVTIHHLQVHPSMTIGTTTTAQVHLDL
jgi:hypothetical protein